MGVDNLTPKQKALLPVVFFDYFNFPLTKDEWQRYSPTGENQSRYLSGLVEEVDSFLVLKGRDKLPTLRLQRAEFARKFWQKVKRWWWLFSWVPFLEGVALSNTLSYGNVGDNSDIDLAIITKANRLWIARAFFSFWFGVFRQRVQSARKFAKFSAEVWLDEKHLDIRDWQIGNDIYLYFWAVDLLPVAGRESFNRFRRANRWLAKFLPKAYATPRAGWRLPLGNPMTGLLEKILSGGLGDALERVAYNQQKNIIEHTVKKIGVNPSIIYQPGVAKLHFNDARQKINRAVAEKLESFI